MASEQKKEAYQEYVRQNSPKTNLPLQMAKAFVMGGVICCLGQFIVNMAPSQFGIEKETAAAWCSMLLILISALLTGFNLYGKLVKWGGAGALVPITGFANSVVASAIEYKTEGQVYGIGCKIVTSWGLGIIYWIGKMAGVF